MYMTPEQAARGLELFENIKDDNPDQESSGSAFHGPALPSGCLCQHCRLQARSGPASFLQKGAG